MQRLLCAIITIFALFAFPSPPNASDDVTYDAAAPPGPIVISHLMWWSGSSGSSADEWIEFYNRSSATIDLSGWTLTRLKTANFRSCLSLTLPLSRRARPSLLPTTLPTTKNPAWPPEPQFVSTSISLPNSKLLLQLYDYTPTNGGQLIDSVDDGRGTPFAGSTAPKQAMVRIAFDQPGHQSTSWATATMQNGWDANATEIGTPGSIPSYFLIGKEDVNQTGINTLIEPRNWGSLKRDSF